MFGQSENNGEIGRKKQHIAVSCHLVRYYSRFLSSVGIEGFQQDKEKAEFIAKSNRRGHFTG
jgi:hypothetical protein